MRVLPGTPSCSGRRKLPRSKLHGAAPSPGRTAVALVGAEDMAQAVMEGATMAQTSAGHTNSVASGPGVVWTRPVVVIQVHDGGSWKRSRPRIRRERRLRLRLLWRAGPSSPLLPCCELKHHRANRASLSRN